MARRLKIFSNGDEVLCFQCSAGVPALQRRQLDELDFRMDDGIELDQRRIEAPDRIQRVHFVVGLLVRALARGDQDAVNGLCAYLANRMPELHAVQVQEQGGSVQVKLQVG